MTSYRPYEIAQTILQSTKYRFNIKTDADRERSELFEYVIRFAIVFVRFQIFYFKVNLLYRFLLNNFYAFLL